MSARLQVFRGHRDSGRTGEGWRDSELGPAPRGLPRCTANQPKHVDRIIYAELSRTVDLLGWRPDAEPGFPATQLFKTVLCSCWTG